jgi:RsiW-degrading membrane proteinase PrsW (M82 family)
VPISFTCECGKKLKARDESAGKRVACPACGHGIVIPDPETAPSLGYALQEQPTPPAPAPPVEDDDDEEEDLPVAPLRRPVALTLEMTTTRFDLRRNLHWLLFIAMVPLAVSIFVPGKGREDIEGRLEKTLEVAPPETRARVERLMEDEETDIDDVLDALPGQKLIDAHLSHGSWRHWLYALATTLFFGSFLCFIGSLEHARMRSVLYVGLFTSTVGILFLEIVQFLAALSDVITPLGGAALVLWVFKFIAFSYRSALDPDANFALSFLGFTLGVGVCEEICKLLPILWVYRRPIPRAWRITMIWGLASGAAFGVSEGIMYSSNFYNGIVGGGTYVVRFVSCVALHAVWTGSAAITLNRRHKLWQDVQYFWDRLPPLVIFVGMPVLLHGLYDTLLKKELDALALAVAVMSFAWLAWQNLERHRNDIRTEQKAMRIRQRHLRATEGTS